jgi:hypothetical protein
MAGWRTEAAKGNDRRWPNLNNTSKLKEKKKENFHFSLQL